METDIKVVHLGAEGMTQGFIAKGNITLELMLDACREQFKPSQYEDNDINIENAKIELGYFRWIPTHDECGEICGSRLVNSAPGPGAFVGTMLTFD